MVYMAQTSAGTGGQPGTQPSNTIIQIEETPNLTISDNKPQGVSSVMTIAQNGLIGSLKVGVDITHTYIGDLRVTLTAPDGTEVVLHNRQGASANNIIKAYDVHTTPALSVLSGKSVQGDWRLNVSDHAGYDVGILNHWDLDVVVNTAAKVQKESEAAIAIPDNDSAGVSDSIEVERSGNVRDIKVSVDITHTWIGDLKIELRSPSGHAIMLHNRSGGQSDNVIKTYDVQNLSALQSLIDEEAQGLWVLKVTDHAGRDVGKLNRWGLEITF